MLMIKRQLEEYQKNRELVETCKTALEEEQEVLQQAKAEVEKEEAGQETPDIAEGTADYRPHFRGYQQ